MVDQNPSSGRFARIEEKLDRIIEDVHLLSNRVLELEYAAKFEDIETKKRVSDRTYKWMKLSIILSVVFGLATLVSRLFGIGS